MTVQELRVLLDKFPSDYAVWIDSWEGEIDLEPSMFEECLEGWVKISL